MSPANSDSSGENSIAHDGGGGGKPSRYESQKRRDWNTFRQYLLNHRPPLELGRCSGAHVLEFLRYLDQFGKTKVHAASCPFFGLPQPPAPCPCPLRQAWGSLDALVGRLRAAFEEDGGLPEANPFAARAVRLYLRDVRDSQAKARGIAHDKKKRKRPLPPSPPQPTIPLAARAMAAVLPATIGQRVRAPAADLNLVINGGYARHLAIPSMDADGDDAAAIAEAQYSGGMIPLSVFN